MTTDERQFVAGAFLPIAERFLNMPIWKKSTAEPNTYRLYDLYNSERIKLLLEWREVTGQARFGEIALAIATNPVDHLSAWRDGQILIKLIVDLRTRRYRIFESDRQLSETLEKNVISILKGHVWPDDLEKMFDLIDLNLSTLSPAIREAMHDAVIQTVEDIEATIENVDSQSTLNDYGDALTRFAPEVGISEPALRKALEAIEIRVSRIKEQIEIARPPDLTDRLTRESDNFNDLALANLFSPLLAGQK
jgi:hypothetical protein